MGVLSASRIIIIRHKRRTGKDQLELIQGIGLTGYQQEAGIGNGAYKLESN